MVGIGGSTELDASKKHSQCNLVSLQLCRLLHALQHGSMFGKLSPAQAWAPAHNNAAADTCE
jgi:hypothetical protein